MAANIWKVGTSNAFNTTLNGGITAGDASITLASVSGIQAPGVLVIDRVDANNTATPTTREYISFTGIAGSAVTGCSRGLGGSSAQSHNSGARVEEVWSITHVNDFIDTFLVSHDAGGKIVSTSTATLSTIRLLTNLNASGASVIDGDLTIWNSLTLSGASINGNFGVHPAWVIGGAVSLATTYVGKPLPMPMGGTWRFFSMVLRTPASGASLVIDINKNGTSIFTDQNTRLLISGGGTYASTASIGTKGFTAGDILSADIDMGGGSGSDLSIIGRGLN